MRIVIAGGHGQIAQQFGKLVAAAGHNPVGMIRKPEHVPDLEANGIEPAMIDLENTDLAAMTEVVRGADAVLFAAGGGPDGNAQRKETVDKGAAIMLADAAEAAGVRRYLMISAMGTEQAAPPPTDGSTEDVMQVYLRAKQAADDYVRSRDLDATIVRPGALTNDVPTGRVEVGKLDYGSVTRGDVAHVLAVTLESDHTIGMTFDVVNGDKTVHDAIEALRDSDTPRS